MLYCVVFYDCHLVVVDLYCTTVTFTVSMSFPGIDMYSLTYRYPWRVFVVMSWRSFPLKQLA